MENLGQDGKIKKGVLAGSFFALMLLGALWACAWPPYSPGVGNPVGNLAYLATPTGTITPGAVYPVAYMPLTITHRVFDPTDRVTYNGAATLSATPVVEATPMAAVYTDVEGYLTNIGSANETVFVARGGVTAIYELPSGYPPFWFNLTAGTANKGVSIWTSATSGATIIGTIDTRKR